MSGDVHIYSCQFTNNNQYDGPGAAIYYLFGTETYPQPLLVITNCTFTSNGPAESVVYISLPNNLNGNLSLYGVMFADNQGTPINISNFHVHVNGTVMFQQNIAMSGGGIYSTNSAINFDNSNVIFINNSATTTNGGAVYLSSSNISFGLNSSVMFDSNRANVSGGGIFSERGSSITFTENSAVSFNNNIAALVGAHSTGRYSNHYNRGGAIYTSSHCHITFDGNSTVMFTNNTAAASAVAVLSTTATTTTANTRLYNYGGAMYASSYSSITFWGNSTVMFRNNGAAAAAIAIAAATAATTSS